MKTIVTLAAFALIAWSMTSCVTTESTTTAPDGTVKVTKITAPDAASVAAANNAVTVIGTRQVTPAK